MRRSASIASVVAGGSVTGPVNPRTACSWTKVATACASLVSSRSDGVVNSENSIRENHSAADSMSRSLRTSPVSLAAVRYGVRNSPHSRSRAAAFFVSRRLTSSASKYFSGSTSWRACVTTTAARASLSSKVRAAVHRECHLAVEQLRGVLGARLDDRGLVAEVLVDGAARHVSRAGDVDDRRLAHALESGSISRAASMMATRVSVGRRLGHGRARMSALVGTPVPEVTSTCSTSSTWLHDVPRIWRTPSVMPFIPWM